MRASVALEASQARASLGPQLKTTLARQENAVKHAVTYAKVFVVLSLLGGLSCARHDPRDRSAGSESVEVSIGCGFALAEPFSGRLVYRDDDGHVHGIDDGRFETEDPDLWARDATIQRNAGGRFRTTLTPRASTRTIRYPDGREQSSEWSQEMFITVTAPGCKSRTLLYSKDWASREIELECPGRDARHAG